MVHTYTYAYILLYNTPVLECMRLFPLATGNTEKSRVSGYGPAAANKFKGLAVPEVPQTVRGLHTTKYVVYRDMLLCIGANHMQPRFQWFVRQILGNSGEILHEEFRRPISPAPPPPDVIFGPDDRQRVFRVLAHLAELRSCVPLLDFAGRTIQPDDIASRITLARVLQTGGGDPKVDTSRLPRTVRPVRRVDRRSTWSSARALAEHLNVSVASVYKHLDNPDPTGPMMKL